MIGELITWILKEPVAISHLHLARSGQEGQFPGRGVILRTADIGSLSYFYLWITFYLKLPRLFFSDALRAPEKLDFQGGGLLQE